MRCRTPTPCSTTTRRCSSGRTTRRCWWCAQAIGWWRTSVGWTFNPDRLHPKGVKGSNATGSPLHDVHLRIEGPGALDLLTTFSKRWHATSQTSSIPLRGDSFAPSGGAVADDWRRKPLLERHIAREVSRGQLVAD